jgi:2-amino-4-hydroxy-6-hydroxymethyldihydropteridine diphosphokinase
MQKFFTTYIALGSNLNHPISQLQTAIVALKQIAHSRIISVSRFYQTAAVGFIDQPDFINAVACLETTLSAQALLLALQKIENAQGRIRQQKNGPRTLDLDILLYGNETITEPKLTIPHPRMYERAFVLIPLLEIAPNLVLPNGINYAEIIAKQSYIAR